MPSIRAIDNTIGCRRVIGDVVGVVGWGFVVELGMKLSFGAVDIGYHRTSSKLLNSHLSLCNLLLDAAKFAMLEENLDVELL